MYIQLFFSWNLTYILVCSIKELAKVVQAFHGCFSRIFHPSFGAAFSCLAFSTPVIFMVPHFHVPHFHSPHIHMSFPDVNMNYIKSLLFLDICIEIVTVKQSALLLFCFSKFGFMCVCLCFSMFFIFLSFGCLYLSLLFYLLHIRLLRALIKINQSVNQNQSIAFAHMHRCVMRS